MLAKSKFFNQLFPVALAVVVCAALILIYLLEIRVLNLFPGERILTEIHWQDVLVGLTIYLKTSVDFALLIGLLMKQYKGTKNRVAIEIGTAVGNALGTMIILVIWYFFKEIVWLLALMIFIAALVLLKLAQTSIEHIFEAEENHDDGVEVSPQIKKVATIINNILNPINNFIAPVLSRIMPNLSFKGGKNLSFWGLAAASFTVPFILGLDDFAGYVPLFNVVNVFGFGIGVFSGHMILNIFLFINPDVTIKVVKNPIIAILGSVVFVGLSLWGMWEVIHLLDHTYHWGIFAAGK